ncbi:hypothetical protein KAREA_10110 [Prescottella equi]|nr:hypothetical protein KAREA_10110 [Prescottella equi]
MAGAGPQWSPSTSGGRSLPDSWKAVRLVWLNPGMNRTLLAAGAALALTLIAGCSDSETLADEQARPSSSAVGAPTSSAVASTSAATPTETSTQGLYEVTDAGLTVAVNVPVVASPAEMAEGCAEAKAVFEMFDTTDVEMVLALMQASEADSTENFTVESDGAPWAEATPQEQAQVIAAVNAAARGEC